MKRLISFLSVGLFGLGALGVPAFGASAGTSGADVLKIGVGARAIGMGEAYTAMADDVSSLYWNPGGLALMQEREASFMYNPQIQDLTYQNAGIGIPLENGALGGSISYLSFGNISAFDNAGNPTGSINAHDAVGTLGAAWLGNQWSTGFNVKGVQESLADVTATGAAFDLGGTIIYPRPIFNGTLRFGAAVQNLGSGMTLLQQTDPFPTTYRIGMAALQLIDKKLDIGLDYVKPRDDSGGVQMGFEYWVVPALAIRTGYASNKNEGSGLRAGLGLRVKSLTFDYAYASGGELGITHRYEVSFRFGEPRPILTAEEYRILQEAKKAMRQGRYDRAVLLFDSLIEMEPHYKPARRLVKVAMASMEHQQGQMTAREGTAYQPGAESSAQKPSLPDLDDLEQLLSVGQPKSADAAGKGQGGQQP